MQTGKDLLDRFSDILKRGDNESFLTVELSAGEKPIESYIIMSIRMAVNIILN